MKLMNRHTAWTIVGSMMLLNFLAASAQAQSSRAIPIFQYGIASWYGEEFHGRQTANGEVYDMFQLTAAHKFAPLGIHAIVTDLDTGRSVRVRINDRGPFVDDRILDLSYASARRLGIIQRGLARVRIQFLLDTTPPEPIYVVQAGAYTSQNHAVRTQRALAVRYPKVWIDTTREGSQLFYRVRLGTFTKRSRAEEIAQRVQALGYSTRVLPMPSHASHRLTPSAKPL
jgi:rare lipoprotein A